MSEFKAEYEESRKILDKGVWGTGGRGLLPDVAGHTSTTS